MSAELSGAAQKIWSWQDSLDALTAAPGNPSVLFENDHVRVLHTRILSGQKTSLHTHRRPSLLFNLTWSDFVRRDQLGNVTLDTRQASEVPKLNTPVWLEKLLPHTVENVGHAEISNVQLEIKSAA